MRNPWRRAIIIVVGATLAASVLVIPAIGQEPITSSFGVLRLHLGADGDRFVFDPDDTGANMVQTLTESSCRVASSGASLVSLIGEGAQANKRPFAGLKDHRLGVGQNGEGTGEPCARINKSLGQTLTLRLTGDLAGMAIDYAEIDLGFKFNGSANLALSRDGSPVDQVVIDCTGGSDCGPDSGASDNERIVLYVDPADAPGPDGWLAIQVAGPFDTIQFSPNQPSNGAISLEGGFDGSAAGPTGTTDTVFNIVEVFDGEIDCGDTANLGGGSDPDFQTTRGDDTDGACKGPVNGLLFNFDTGSLGDGRKFVDFVTVNPGSGTGTAQFLEEINWTSDAPPDTEAGDDQLATLTYDDHVGAGERVMPWCLMDPRVGGNLPTGTEEDPVDTSLILPEGHTSCLIASESHVTLFGSYVSTDTVYGIADGFRAK